MEAGRNIALASAELTDFKVPRIKVCGMTSLDQMEQLADMGVQLAGMIFYHKSPRYVVRHLKGDEVKKAKLKILKVGVFVNASYDEVLNNVDEFGLDLVQLHGDETPYYCSKLSESISVIKAFRITEDCDIEWKKRNYSEVTNMYLFDTDGAGYGGTGKKFNWGKLQELSINKPFILSGGIEPGDVGSIREFINQSVAKDLFAVDINSKFELSPGVKDIEKVSQFVSSLTNNNLND